MFISICSHLFTWFLAGLARLPSGDLSREGETHTGQEGCCWALLGCTCHHFTLHNLLQLYLLLQGDGEIMMFHPCSKPSSWLIKVWQEQEQGWLNRLWCWELGREDKCSFCSSCLCDTKEPRDQEGPRGTKCPGFLHLLNRFTDPMRGVCG